MTTRSRLSLLMTLALLWASPRPTSAYFDYPPPTLGALCLASHNIDVLVVDKVSTEKKVLLYTVTRQLKATKVGPQSTKHVIVANYSKGEKAILGAATPGKTAVFFRLTNGPAAGLGHVYLDGCWYSISYDPAGDCWRVFLAEPGMLTRYCGKADQLGRAVEAILRGEEVVVPCKAADLKPGTLHLQDEAILGAKTQLLRASLKITKYDPRKHFAGWADQEP